MNRYPLWLLFECNALNVLVPILAAVSLPEGCAGRVIGLQIAQCVLNAVEVMAQDVLVPVDVVIMPKRAVEDAPFAVLFQPGDREKFWGPAIGLGLWTSSRE